MDAHSDEWHTCTFADLPYHCVMTSGSRLCLLRDTRCTRRQITDIRRICRADTEHEKSLVPDSLDALRVVEFGRSQDLLV